MLTSRGWSTHSCWLPISAQVIKIHKAIKVPLSFLLLKQAIKNVSTAIRRERRATNACVVLIATKQFFFSKKVPMSWMLLDFITEWHWRLVMHVLSFCKTVVLSPGHSCYNVSVLSNAIVNPFDINCGMASAISQIQVYSQAYHTIAIFKRHGHSKWPLLPSIAAMVSWIMHNEFRESMSGNFPLDWLWRWISKMFCFSDPPKSCEALSHKSGHRGAFEWS